MASKKNRKFKFFVRVADIGLFQSVIQTRARLMVSALAATLIALGMIYVGSAWMRESSASAMMNVLFISLMLTGLIVASYIDALLLGDLFFPGKWRERVLLGHEVNLDEELDETVIKEYNPHFMIVLMALIFVLFWVSQKITDGYIWYYEDVGFAITLMRSDDADERYFALEEISNPLRTPVWQNTELHKQITVLVDDPEPRVRVMAVYVAGRLDVTSASERILKHFRETDSSELRAEAAIALGRLKWKAAIPHLSSHLAKPSIVSDEAVGILRGFSFFGSADEGAAGPTIVSLLEGCNTPDGERLPEAVVINAFYAIKETRFDGGREIAQRYLEGNFCSPSLPERCSAANALRYIGKPDDIPFLKRAFQGAQRDDYCDANYWKFRKEGLTEIIDKEPLRAKILRAVGNQKDFDTYEWMWSIGANEEEHPETRKVSETYTTEMYELHERKQKGR